MYIKFLNRLPNFLIDLPNIFYVKLLIKQKVVGTNFPEWRTMANEAYFTVTSSTSRIYEGGTPRFMSTKKRDHY